MEVFKESWCYYSSDMKTVFKSLFSEGHYNEYIHLKHHINLHKIPEQSKMNFFILMRSAFWQYLIFSSIKTGAQN